MDGPYNFLKNNSFFDAPDDGDLIYPYDDIFSTISADNIAAPSYYEIEPVWKSASLVAQNPISSNGYIAAFDDKEIMKQSSLKSFSQKSDGQLNKQLAIIEESKAIVPEMPFVLMPTHFKVARPLSLLILQVQGVLNDLAGVSHEFDSLCCEWNAVYFSGAIYCKFKIYIYRADQNTDNFVIEGNRLSGDAPSFRAIYNQLKLRMTQSNLSPSDDLSPTAVMDSDASDGYANYPPSDDPTDAAAARGPSSPREDDAPTTALPMLAPVPAAECSEETILAGIAVVLRMAKERTVDAHVEAARILCDLTLDEEMQIPLLRSGTVGILTDLIASSASELARQHAVFALANLSECSLCLEAIVDAGALPQLLNLAMNCQYQFSEMRRLTFFILANICVAAGTVDGKAGAAEKSGVATLASRVMGSLDKMAVTAWLEALETVKDDRLRLHANRARESLSAIFAI